MKKQVQLKELKDLSPAEMEKKVKEAKQELMTLRFQLAVGQLENTAKLKQTKRTIARLNTLLTQAQAAK